MKKYNNSRKKKFLKSLPTKSIESKNDTLTKKCKFNFGYMDFNQKAGQNFEDWEKKKLKDLLNKVYEFSKESLKYWKNQKIGSKSNKVLEIYKNFPKKSKFSHPKHVPHEAWWARFRLGSKIRLIGFVLPDKFDNIPHNKTGKRFDCNTFYAVFLDKNHDFYLSNKK